MIANETRKHGHGVLKSLCSKTKLPTQSRVKLFLSVSNYPVVFMKHNMNINKVNLKELYVVKQMRIYQHTYIYVNLLMVKIT